MTDRTIDEMTDEDQHPLFLRYCIWDPVGKGIYSAEYGTEGDDDMNATNEAEINGSFGPVHGIYIAKMDNPVWYMDWLQKAIMFDNEQDALVFNQTNNLNGVVYRMDKCEELHAHPGQSFY